MLDQDKEMSAKHERTSNRLVVVFLKRSNQLFDAPRFLKNALPEAFRVEGGAHIAKLPHDFLLERAVSVAELRAEVGF